MMGMTPNAKGMVGMKKTPKTVSIVMGNKQVKTLVAIGNIPGVVCNNQGNQVLPVKMTNIALVPDCAFNLFSISKRLKQGWLLGGNANALELISPSGKHQIKFNIKISMPNGMLFTMYIKCMQEEVASVAAMNDCEMEQLKMSVQQAHEKLGHINERATKEIAQNLGWLLTNNQLLNCTTCAPGKSKQKSQESEVPDDEKDRYCTYLDISTVKKNEKYPITANRNWRMIVMGTQLQLSSHTSTS